MPLYFYLKIPYDDRVKAFTEFKAKHTTAEKTWQKKFEVYETYPKVNYGRLILRWYEQLTNDKVIEHIYAATINLKSGDVYIDCRVRKLYLKILTATFIRSIVLVCKTITHVLFIPIILKLIETLRSNQKEKWIDFKVTCWQSIKDIIRGPLYETAMLVVQVFTLILTPFCPYIIYKARELNSFLELKANRITENLYDHLFIGMQGWILMPCFVPVFNLGNNLRYDQENTDDNIFKNLNEKVQRYVTKLRESKHPFNNCCKLYPKDIAYISAATPKEALNNLRG